MLEQQPAEGTHDPSVVASQAAASVTIGGEVPGIMPFMIGNSPATRDVFEQIRRFATCDAPVLITGESGTGKELVSRAIHEHSRRSTEAFITVNCAALPATLIGSELFGYEKGAFTGAVARKRGLIEHAHRGTLFLDEIGDLPLELQGHLMRFLQEGEFVRIGGEEPIKVDVRVIAATNVRLRDAIASGKLREDLYYRLNVLGLQLPPLRERSDDIQMLATFFLRQITQDLGRDVAGFTAEAIAAMQAYPWPGNVRELVATIRRAVVLSNGPLVEATDLKLENLAPPAAPSQPSRPSPGTSAERDLLMRTLQQFRYNITKTAQELRVSRVTLYRMLQRNRLALRQECVVQDLQSPEAVH